MAKKPGVKELTDAYNKHGPTSQEFFDVLKNFIFYLQHRYLGYVDEDLTSTSYIRVINSFEYYNPKDGANVGSWVFSVVRNQVSSFIYDKKKRMKESDDMLPILPDKKVTLMSDIQKKDEIHNYFSMFERITVVITDLSIIDELMIRGFEGFLHRDFLWENTKFVSN